MTVPSTLGLRHLAVWVAESAFEDTVRFYCDVVGLAVDWQPDADNVYLTSGRDNLALHRVKPPRTVDLSRSSLDHLGFLAANAEAVHEWFAHVTTHAETSKAKIVSPVKRHRDGSTSFYARDPAGNVVQFIHIPSISADDSRGTDRPC